MTEYELAKLKRLDRIADALEHIGKMVEVLEADADSISSSMANLSLCVDINGQLCVTGSIVNYKP